MKLVMDRGDIWKHKRLFECYAHITDVSKNHVNYLITGSPVNRDECIETKDTKAVFRNEYRFHGLKSLNKI